MPEGEIDRLLPKGTYEIEQSLGRGAFGTVYRGRHTATGREVVLKFLHLPDAESLARIDREIGVLKAIPDDRHIASFSDGYLSPDARSAVLISEWINGPSLQSLVEEHGRGLPANVIASIARQLCAGLAHLHECSIVHRDIKPSNVLLTTDGIVKLVDFGLAIGSAEGTVGTKITAVGSFVGTLRYAAPEMIMGRQFSPRSDIYALGVTILFMILGRPPLPDATVPYLLHEASKGAVLRDLSEEDAPCPPSQEEVLLPALFPQLPAPGCVHRGEGTERDLGQILRPWHAGRDAVRELGKPKRFLC